MGFTYLDMFCGAGGSSLGASQAGGTLVGAIDGWGAATEVLRSNHPEAHDRIFTRLLTATSRPSTFMPREVDLLLASPECTNHSPAKGSAPRCETSRSTASYVLNYVSALNPRWIVIENVVQMRSWSGYERLLDRLWYRGYHISEQILDAADFGVPQNRRRLFLICGRDGEPANVQPTVSIHRPATDAVQVDSAWRSTPLFNGRRAEATLARHRRAVERFGPRKPYLRVYYGSDGSGGAQSLTRPLRTLTTLDRFGLVTWTGDTPHMRMLQVDELKAGMGFPADYSLGRASRREQVRMLGNGVCPPVMRAIVSTLTGGASTNLPADMGATRPTLPTLAPCVSAAA